MDEPSRVITTESLSARAARGKAMKVKEIL
jgi:hypothetical protein